MKVLALPLVILLYVKAGITAMDIPLNCQTEPELSNGILQGDDFLLSCGFYDNYRAIEVDACIWKHNGRECIFGPNVTSTNCEPSRWFGYHKSNGCGLMVINSMNSMMESDVGDWTLTVISNAKNYLWSWKLGTSKHTFDVQLKAK